MHICTIEPKNGSQSNIFPRLRCFNRKITKSCIQHEERDTYFYNFCPLPIREPPSKKCKLYLVCLGRGVEMLAPMVWGTFLGKNCPSSNGHLLDFWGSKPLPGWFGALREAPVRLVAPLFGHCPNSDYTPPHSNGHSGALFFRADLSKFAKSPF